MKSAKPSTRRGFLFTAGAASATVISAAAMSPGQQASLQSSPALATDEEVSSGYQLSDHIKHYYRTAEL